MNCFDFESTLLIGILVSCQQPLRTPEMYIELQRSLCWDFSWLGSQSSSVRVLVWLIRKMGCHGAMSTLWQIFEIFKLFMGGRREAVVRVYVICRRNVTLGDEAYSISKWWSVGSRHATSYQICARKWTAFPLVGIKVDRVYCICHHDKREWHVASWGCK